LLPRAPPTPPLFPYTTLFRSRYLVHRRSGGILPHHRTGPSADGSLRHPRQPQQKRMGLPCLAPSPASGRGLGRGRIAPSPVAGLDRKSTRLNSSHVKISYAVF